MNETARKQRNEQRLAECFPAFAQRMEAVIKDMEAEGFRPRIQDAHRTIADQLKAFNGGFSKVKFGFHNVTGANGKPESLAVDLLDDDNPLNPPRKYLIRLAAIAQANGLQTGIFFGLPQGLRQGLSQAIADSNFSSAVKMGFDPTHVEVTGISIAEAKAGKRPS
ncbi:MAG TPA: hypothetical protein VNN73_14095 [Blastocatellia bacterium]|nr:hypothetical protein [Blastocatellia bacterium]